MDTSQPPVPDKDDEIRAALQRREQHILDASTAHLSAAPSWGERLVPFLLAAMEACCVVAVLIGLASINFFQSHEPLMPLWAPFVLIVGAVWLMGNLERREAAAGKLEGSGHVSGSGLVYVLIGVLMLFIIWSSVYASSTFFFNPAWLLSLLNDILLLSPPAYHVLGIILLSFYLGWRGVRLARLDVEPGHVYRLLRLGMGIIIAVIIVRAGAGAGGLFGLSLLLLIPLFLALALTAHAFSNAVFVRHSHPGGLQGSIVAQERSLLTVIGTVCALLLLVAFLVATFASPSFLVETQRALTPLGQFYDWLTGIIASVLVFLATPLFWLFSLIHFQPPRIRQVQPPVKQGSLRPRPATPPEAVLAVAAVLKVLLPLLFVSAVVGLVWLALRRRRITLQRRKSDTEVHESLWSWELFWQQLKAFFLALWRRFFPQPAIQTASIAAVQEISGPPAVRSIREIYRAMLNLSATRGYPRKKDETPYEFRQRLDEHLPEAEPHLETVTEAYASVRYGEHVPDEADLAHVQRVWHDLQQKLQKPQ